MKMPFTISWEKITPEIAREFLTHNRKNRRLRENTVVSYAQDMRLGEWLANHQGIAFDQDGNLIDGQHRCAAVVASGVTIYSLVTRLLAAGAKGKGARTMDTIDRGAVRSVADMLQLGHGTVDARAVTSTCQLLAKIASRDANRARRMTIPQALAVLELWRPHIAFAVGHRSPLHGLRSSMVVASVAFAHAVKAKPVEEFYLSLVSGEGLQRDTPVLTIRNHVLDKKNTYSSKTEKLRFADAMLTAIYCHLRGEKMPRVTAQSEAIEYFRKPQGDAIARVEEIFPKIAAGVIGGALAPGAGKAAGG